MYNRSRAIVLRWLKVPPEPQPPHGDPASLRVFRAGKNYYKLRMWGWALAEILAFAGILFWAGVFVHVEETARHERARRTATVQAAAVPNATFEERTRQTAERLAGASERALNEVKGTPEKAAAAKKRNRRGARHGGGWNGFISGLVEIAIILPPWAFPVLWILKITGIGIYFLQLPLTYAVRRLDFEMRWYVVTDRSLRIRAGVWNVQESTMSFANLQQVEVTQGPLQRLLGLADVKVQSAGGSDNPQGKPQNDLHTGHFHGVDNAQEIRDLILARLKRFRETGLGDPDEVRAAPPATDPDPSASVLAAAPADTDVLAAARELAAEARALRIALG